jgi:hypothetical protein
MLTSKGLVVWRISPWGGKMQKVRMNLGGQSVEAEKMEFKPLEEEWSRYKLEDGTVVKVKAVDIFKLTVNDPVTGLPQVLVRSGNVISVEPPAPPLPKKEVN